ncbi:MAG: D-amino-acid transaminase [Pseudomonadota bacterium]
MSRPLSRIAYVNGRYRRKISASVNIEDRGYQFADGVYEVCLFMDGGYWDFEGHLARLRRSLSELQIPEPMGEASLAVVMTEVVRRNRLDNALVYVQVSRGVARRNHAFPKAPTFPSVVVTASPFDIDGSDRAAAAGVAVITREDIRWGRVDIKTVGLLPNVLAKQQAVEAGAAEAWLVRDGVVTEGTSSNAWIVNKDGALVTHPKSTSILSGITRATAIECARDLQIEVIERPFSLEEARGAREAFITSATNLIMPVISIDGAAVGAGRPGDVALRLRDAYKLKVAGRIF